MSYESEVVDAITKLVAVTEGLKDNEAADMAQKLILQQEAAKLQADNTLGMAIVTDMMEADKEGRISAAEILASKGVTEIGLDDRPYLGLGDPDDPDARAEYGEQAPFDDERRARTMVDYNTRIQEMLPSLKLQAASLAASKYMMPDSSSYDQSYQTIKTMRDDVQKSKDNYEKIDAAAQHIASGRGMRWTQKLFKGKKLAAYEMTNQNLAELDSLLAMMETSGKPTSSY